MITLAAGKIIRNAEKSSGMTMKPAEELGTMHLLDDIEPT